MPARSIHITHRARWSLSILATVGGVLHPALAWAQGSPFGSSMIDVIATTTTFIVTILHLLTWVVFFYLNILLSPTFIFDLDGNNFMDMLNNLWQFSRDMVNVVFAFALIGVAVMTVVMAKKDYIVEHWQKFVLAIILVNFSWLFPRLILDAANVAAATVYSIPTIVANTNECRTDTVGFIADPAADCQTTLLGANIYNCKCFYVNDLKMFIDGPEYNAINNTDGWTCPLSSGVLCYQRKILDFSAVAGHSAILNGLVVNHARLQALASIPPATGGTAPIDQILRFLLRELLVVIFHVLILFPLFALFVAFLIRIPVLWLTIAAMPFYFLGWVLPEKLTGGYTQKIMDLFLKAAFLPAIVGIPLSVGFIMVNAGTNLRHAQLESMATNILPGISNVWGMLWMFISMGVVWVGVFAVLKEMDIMGKGSEMINSFGKTLGGIALKLPLAAPIIPSIGGKSILALPQTIRGVDAALGQGVKWDQLFNRGGELGDTATAAKNLAPTSTQNTQKLTDLTKALEKISGDISAGRLRPDQAAAEVNKSTEKVGFKVDASNMQGKLSDFLSELRRQNGANANIPALNQEITKLAGVLSPPPPAAPAAPAAGGAPAGAPAAPGGPPTP